MTVYNETVAEVGAAVESFTLKEDRDLINPGTSATLYRKFGEMNPSLYADADAAYDAWCAELGVSSTGTDYTVSNTYLASDWVDIGFAPVDGSVYTKIFIAHGGSLMLFNTAPADETYSYNQNYGYSGVNFVYTNIPNDYPVLTVGPDDQGTPSAQWDNSELKLRKGVLASTPKDEVICIFSRRTYAGNQYLTRMAFRLRVGYLEVVITKLLADKSGECYFQYVLTDESTDTPSDASTSRDITDTAHFYSLDLSLLRPSIGETFSTASTLAVKSNLNTVQGDTHTMADVLNWTWGQVLTDLPGMAGTLTYSYLPGAVVNEVVRYQETMLPGFKFAPTLTDVARMRDAVATAYPQAITDTVTLAEVVQASRGCFVIEQLRLTETLPGGFIFLKSLAETMRVVDSLRNFFSGTISEGVGVLDATSQPLSWTPTLTDYVNLAPVLGHAFIMRVTVPEGIGIDDVDVLRMTYNGMLADGMQLTAAYLSPGATSFTTWAVNTRTGAVTEYDNFAFNSFASLGNIYLGASEDGLYELHGDTDAGTNIVARAKTGFAQFGGSRYTAFKAAYLGLRGTGDFYLRLETGDGNLYTYRVQPDTMRTTKVQLGKGLRARYFAFELESTGQDFDLDSVEFVPMVASRRV